MPYTLNDLAGDIKEIIAIIKSLMDQIRYVILFLKL